MWKSSTRKWKVQLDEKTKVVRRLINIWQCKYFFTTILQTARKASKSSFLFYNQINVNAQSLFARMNYKTLVNVRCGLKSWKCNLKSLVVWRWERLKMATICPTQVEFLQKRHDSRTRNSAINWKILWHRMSGWNILVCGSRWTRVL